MIKRLFVLFLALCLTSNSYAWFRVSQHHGFNAYPKQVVIEHTANSADFANNSSYAFSATSIGTANENRKILVGAVGDGGGSARTITSVTVAGNSSTQIVYAQDGTGNAAGFYIVSVPTGTTGDIVVTWSGTMQNCQIDVFSIVGGSVFDSVSETTDTGTSHDAQVNSPAHGAVVGIITGANAQASITWGSLTKASGERLSDPFRSAAHVSYRNGSPFTETVTLGTSASEVVLLLVSFAPQ